MRFELLVRTKPTQKGKKMDKKDIQQKNLYGAFAFLGRKNVILVI